MIGGTLVHDGTYAYIDAPGEDIEIESPKDLTALAWETLAEWVREDIRRYKETHAAATCEEYIEDIGWQEYMNAFTEAEEGEPVTEAESRAIDKWIGEQWEEETK